MMSHVHISLGVLQICYFENDRIAVLVVLTECFDLRPEFSLCRRHMGPHVHTSLPYRLLPLQAMQIDFRSSVMVSIQSNLGLPGLLVVQESFCRRMACFGIVSSSMRSTCPSHLGVLSLMIRPIPCTAIWFVMSSLCTWSFHVIPRILRWNLWRAASKFFFSNWTP